MTAHYSNFKNRRISGNNLLFFSSKNLLLVVFIFAFLTISFWLVWRIVKTDDQGKFLVAMAGGEKFRIVSFDFENKEISVVEIPANTQVEVARSLGSWELSSVWNLGENEKVGGGELLTQTLRDNFFAPVFFWTSEKGVLLLSDNSLACLSFVLSERKSNLDFIQRVKLAFFSVRFKGSNLTRIDLSQTPFLEQSRLKTGKDGFLIKGDLPEDLLWVYADPLFLKNKVFVSIVNETGGSLVVSKVGKIIESMGGKILAVENQNITDSDCEVYSSNLVLAKRLSSVFSCKVDKSMDYKVQEGEVVIRIGKKFKDRF